MEVKTKICSECNTENEEKYEYCKNCGAPLLSAEAEEFETNFDKEDFNPQHFENQNYTQNANFNSNPQYTHSNVFTETVEGLPYSDYAIFVGKKGDKYMPVFSKLEITSSKVAWHWPTAILGFFFGPLGAAIWFFYRKLYKPALLLTAIGAVLLIINAIIMGPTVANFMDSIDGEKLYSSIVSGDIFDEAEAVENKESSLADIITETTDLATGILCGLFAHHIYKRHIHKTIMKYRESHVDSRYYQMALSSLGGTSDGMIVLGIIILIFSSNISSLIYLLF